MMRKTQANILLGAALAGGVLFIAAIITATGASVALIPSAYADANCDKAQAELNNQGKVRGNPKQCLGFSMEGEQPRSCHSPNAFKDNDEDGTATCLLR